LIFSRSLAIAETSRLWLSCHPWMRRREFKSCLGDVTIHGGPADAALLQGRGVVLRRTAAV
jgi:hypothetical protein